MQQLSVSIPTGEPVGVLNLATYPYGCEVYIDGQFQEYTPLIIEGIPSGNHVVSIESEDAYREFEITVT